MDQLLLLIVIFANYMFVGRGLTQIYADKTNKKVELFSGNPYIKMSLSEKVSLSKSIEE
jgi:hypothetical protein